jgi:hypothetical protein
MSTLRLWRNTILAGFLACSFPVALIHAASAARSSGDSLFEMIPAKCLFCVRVNNLDQTLTQMDQFLTGVSPVGIAMPVRAFFGNALGNPQLNGLNMAGSFAVFAPLPNSEPGKFNIGILVPVTDYKQFTETNPNVSKPDEKGISKITTNNAPPLSIVQVRNYALIGLQGTETQLLATAQAITNSQLEKLSATLDADEVKQAANEPLWVYGDIQLVNKMFGPMLLAQIEEAKKSLQQMAPKGQPPMGNMSSIMNMYTSILETLLKETKSLSIAVRPKPNVLNIVTTVSAMPGTDMSAMFASDSSAAQKNRLLPYLQDGSMMNLALKTSGSLWREHTKANTDLVAAMTGKAPSDEAIVKMKALTADMVNSVGDCVALSMSVDSKAKPPFAIRYVIAVKDEKTFYRVMDQATEMMKSGAIADLYASLGMKLSLEMKRGVDRYKDAAIDSIKYAIASTDPNSQVGQMINTMYGSGLNGRSAMVDGLYVIAVGGDPDAAVRGLIDQVKAPGSKTISAETKTALDLLPQADKADLLATFNFLKVIQMTTAYTPMPMPQMDIPSKSNIAFAVTTSRGKMATDIAVPKDHLMEIVQFFQKMQQQQMQIRQQMQNRQQQKDAQPATR